MATRADLGQPVWAFSDWMKIGIPLVVVMVPLAFWVLSVGLAHQKLPALPSLPSMTKRERRVLFVFGLTALGWITRIEPLGGWTKWVGAEAAGDSTVAFCGLLLMLLLPAGDGKRLMTWRDAERAPWGILLLFGGGLALASAFAESGLSARIAGGLTVLTEFPPAMMVLGVALVVTFLTEMTSNTATAALLMPILAATAESVHMDPTRLMAPAALSASCAFMLPVATAPNAIIFASGEVRTRFMLKRGIVLNLLGALVVTAVVVLLL
jgi:sodium-dependent dicarboxylate transporter 2/3/5